MGIALASSSDPQQALAEARETNRKGVAKHRAERSYVSPQPDNDLPEPVTPEQPIRRSSFAELIACH
jgi:hypothetical protein